ncbi:MAG TPA: hypothetical protein VN612_17695 [Acidobacteriaceae bacterium]|nr:hypothetical protein [Acidobacteriaceae bacterium]
MSSEQNLSESSSYQDYSPAQITGPNSDGDGSRLSAPGMGQSKSSRRRRRKRKNKLAASAGGPEAATANGQFAGDIQASGQSYAAPAPQQQGFQPQPGQNQGGKRWKKKFRDRQRGGDNVGNQAGAYSNGNGAYRDKDSHQPGNNAFAGGKRKGKQRDRGPRGFVGPMDHSYRAVNGNFAEGPAATIDTFGGGRGGRNGYVSDSQPIDYSIGRAIPIPEDAPTRIFFFIEDLFFNAKINETARKLGVKVAFIRGEKTEKETIAELTAGDEVPGLIVFDLNNANAKPLTLIPKLKTKLKKGTSIIGFLQHIQGDLKAKAVEAGCDTVMPRAAFSQNLPNLLRRYGTQEEEDDRNYNQ